MTTHYVDITLLPDPEFSRAHLLGALYDRLHLALVSGQHKDIGISFPGYSWHPRTLGDVMRLHGGQERLAAFTQPDWLRGMRDHVRLGSVASAPPDALHRTVRRRQFKTNVERLRRRRMRRKGETWEEAARAIPTTVAHHPQLPFAHLRSHSTGQIYCVFIELGDLQPNGQYGLFSSHGLSDKATVPWF